MVLSALLPNANIGTIFLHTVNSTGIYREAQCPCHIIKTYIYIYTGIYIYIYIYIYTYIHIYTLRFHSSSILIIDCQDLLLSKKFCFYSSMQI